MKKPSIWPILVVLFLGFVGFSITLPLFPPLFLDKSYTFLSETASYKTRNTVLGILLAMYPLGQFIGCPILGKLSDRFGRKKVLMISLAAIIPTYVGSALAITYSMPTLLFISRITCGLFEGNVTIAQASLADLSSNLKEKTRNFGWSMTISSLAFVIGPLIGGLLADKSIASWFTLATPFWFAGIMIGLAWIYIAWRYRETAEPNPESEIHPLRIFGAIFRNALNIRIRSIYLANFLLFISFFFFFSFLPVYLVARFDFSASLLAKATAYLSIPLVIAPLFYSRLSKWFSPPAATVFAGLFLAGAILLILPFDTPYALYGTLLPPGFFIAIGFTYTALMISEKVDRNKQGEALGVNQSLQVLSEGLTALVGGALAGISYYLPLAIGAVFAFLSALYLLFLRRNGKA